MPSAHVWNLGVPWVVLLVTLASGAWLAWVASAAVSPAWPGSSPTVTSIVVVLGLAGGLVVGLSRIGYAEAFPCVAVFCASVQMPLRWSAPALAMTIVAMVLGSGLRSTPAGGLAQATLIPVGVFLAGLNRRQFRIHAL